MCENEPINYPGRSRRILGVFKTQRANKIDGAERSYFTSVFALTASEQHMFFPRKKGRKEGSYKTVFPWEEGKVRVGNGFGRLRENHPSLAWPNAPWIDNYNNSSFNETLLKRDKRAHASFHRTVALIISYLSLPLRRDMGRIGEGFGGGNHPKKLIQKPMQKPPKAYLRWKKSMNIVQRRRQIWVIKIWEFSDRIGNKLKVNQFRNILENLPKL